MARLLGRAELFKERLDRDRLKDPETGVEHLVSTLKPYFIKDGQSVFLYRFFQMFRCNRGQTDFQRWMVKYEIARQKTIEIRFDITTPRPDPAGAQMTAEVERLLDAAHVRRRLRTEARQACVGVPDGLQAHLDAIAGGYPEANQANSTNS